MNLMQVLVGWKTRALSTAAVECWIVLVTWKRRDDRDDRCCIQCCRRCSCSPSRSCRCFCKTAEDPDTTPAPFPQVFTGAGTMRWPGELQLAQMLVRGVRNATIPQCHNARVCRVRFVRELLTVLRSDDGAAYVFVVGQKLMGCK